MPNVPTTHTNTSNPAQTQQATTLDLTSTSATGEGRAFREWRATGRDANGVAKNSTA